MTTAGITGHQDLGDDADIAWVRQALRRVVREERVTAGVSSLAAGADQLFAQVLREAGLPLIAVIPCAGYAAAFATAATRRAFERLRDEAAEQVELDFPAPGEEAFMAAGREVVRRSDLLVAVWDGQPSRGLGGTADVVAHALGIHRRTLHVHPASRTVRELLGR
jgi:hypothetical protein